MTGREVADQKSVIRFLLTISDSALPRSSLEEDSPRLVVEEGEELLDPRLDWSWIGELTETFLESRAPDSVLQLEKKIMQLPSKSVVVGICL